MMDNGRPLFTPNEAQREVMRDMTVLLLAPCADYDAPVRWMSCALNATAYAHRHGLRVDAMGYTERRPVNWARKDLARMGLKTEDPYTGKPFSHFLWLDDDQIFNADMFVRLAAHGDLDMVSAVYYGRNAPHYPTIYLKDDTPNEFSHWPVLDLPEAVVQVDACGFGALLMRREVLEGTPEPWFEINDKVGEDISFCVRARKAGFTVWADGQYQIGHLGRVPIVTRADSLRHREENPEKYQGKYRVELQSVCAGGLVPASEGSPILPEAGLL